MTSQENAVTHHLTRRGLGAAALAFAVVRPRPSRAAAPSEIRVDWATYNPVSLVLKNQRLLENEFAADGIGVRWVFSAGSNKALEFLNAGSLDFGSTAGAAALVGRINGNPIRMVYVYSRPEWTALVTKGDSPIKSVADLKGQRIAVTRGTDPHIFLVRALATAGLTEKDVKLVLVQHADGRTAMERGDVIAWAGLDPMMAAAEIEGGARLFYRKPEANTWGTLNVRDAFAAENPALVRRVLTVYERARIWAVANPAELKAMMMTATKLSDPVITRQLERTDLSSGMVGERQAATIVEAGKALQAAGVLDSKVDVVAVTNGLIDSSFARAVITA
ncbi:MAG: aliphatic sulfonate ABC transporter substrate-binding protein [Acetobacteraceae bacterium]